MDKTQQSQTSDLVWDLTFQSVPVSLCLDRVTVAESDAGPRAKSPRGAVLALRASYYLVHFPTLASAASSIGTRGAGLFREAVRKLLLLWRKRC